MKQQKTEIDVDNGPKTIRIVTITTKNENIIEIEIQKEEKSILDKSLLRGSCPYFS